MGPRPLSAQSPASVPCRSSLGLSAPKALAPALTTLALATLALVPFAASPLAAQHAGHGPAAVGGPAEEAIIPLFENLGTLSRPITTSVPLAQEYFDQGVRLVYGFGHGSGVRSFREAQRLDPTCASCFWGEAWALGPNINGRMGNAQAVEAHAAIQRALELKAGATPVEQALIDAMAVRYAPDPEQASREALDTVYMRAMEEVGERFPTDLEVLTLLGEAHMVLRPWNYWTPEGDAYPGVERAVEVLERALALDLSHPGACHLYIHLVEASPDPDRGAPCSDLLADEIPGVSHIPHMPSHIYMRIGRYGDGVRGNQRAWIADQRAAFDGAPGVYPTHNLHMLFFSAAFDGQSAVALQAARDLARLSDGFSFYVPLGLVRFGRWDEILERPLDEGADFRTGFHHFARGMARIRAGAVDLARVELQALDVMRSRVPEGDRFRGHLQRDLLGMARGTLAGEILAAEGDVTGAVRELEAAIGLEAALNYDEPEPWPIPVRHTLGAVLLEAGRAADAERVYREALDIHRENGWSLHGLAAALRAQGRIAEADAVQARFDQAWVRADVWVLGSRY